MVSYGKGRGSVVMGVDYVEFGLTGLKVAL